MKILKRNYGHRNLLVFLALSLVYLQAIASLAVGRSLFSIPSLRSFFIEHYLILAGTIITGFFVTRLKKYSESVLLVCLIVIVGKNFILLSGSFNKLTLVLNFLYLVFAFYFFVNWELEVGLAAFNPNFTRFDLEKESRFKLSGKIELTSLNQSVDVFITNLDEESCFLLLPHRNDITLSTSQTYTLVALYEGVLFKHNARLVSSYDRGIGLVFERSPNIRLTWSELYKVCLERGLVS
jgi:hypothetical protein